MKCSMDANARRPLGGVVREGRELMLGPHVHSINSGDQSDKIPLPGYNTVGTLALP